MKTLFKKICIASDHAGFKLKENIKDFLITKNISIIDLGPEIAKCLLITQILLKKFPIGLKLNKSDVGILVCGSGTGMAISANKVKGSKSCGLLQFMKSTRLSTIA